MNARIHRATTSVLTSLAALSALLSATDPSTLEVSQVTWAWCSVVLAVASVVTTGIRQFFGDRPVAP